MSSGDERSDRRIERQASDDEAGAISSGDEKDPFYGCYTVDSVFLACVLNGNWRPAHSLMAVARRVIRSLCR